MSRSIFYQDNESATKLEKNGLKSSGERTRHINIRYFFIKDILMREKIHLEHCKTERMLADFLTKPLQGSNFKRIRDIIMGVATFPVEERVDVSNPEKLIATKNVASAGSGGVLTYAQIVKRGGKSNGPK